MTFRGARLL